MSKQINYNEATKIYKLIIKNKHFDISLEELLKKNNIKEENEIKIINQIIELLSENNFEIESINPLKIKEI